MDYANSSEGYANPNAVAQIANGLSATTCGSFGSSV